MLRRLLGRAFSHRKPTVIKVKKHGKEKHNQADNEEKHDNSLTFHPKQIAIQFVPSVPLMSGFWMLQQPLKQYFALASYAWMAVVPIIQTASTLNEPQLALQQNRQYANLIRAGTGLYGFLAACGLSFFDFNTLVIRIGLPILIVGYNTAMMFAEYYLLKEDTSKCMARLLVRGFMNTLVMICAMLAEKLRQQLQQKEPSNDSPA